MSTLKNYQCVGCGKEQKQHTNHFGTTYGRCAVCGTGNWQCLDTLDGERTAKVEPPSMERAELEGLGRVISHRIATKIYKPDHEWSEIYTHERMDVRIELRQKKQGLILSVVCDYQECKPNGTWRDHRNTNGGAAHDEIVKRFPELEELCKWHLNDMHAECEHQRARGETWKTHPSAKCPDCGYKLGHAWLFVELPAHIVELATTFGKDRTK